MDYKKGIFLSLVLIFIMSCKHDKNDQKDNVDDVNYKEEDYYKVQGIIVKINSSFSYSSKFKRDYMYIYHLDKKSPSNGIEKNSDLLFDLEDPVAIMVNKKDSTDTFIGHRGIIDEETLVNYLSREDNNYESWFDKKYLKEN